MTSVILTYSSWRRPQGDEIVLDLHRHEIARWGSVVHLPPTAFRMVAALIVAPGYLSIRELAEHVYGEREDGGPIDPRNCFYVAASRFRAPLSAIGIEIRGHYSRGWRAVISSSVVVERRAA